MQVCLVAWAISAPPHAANHAAEVEHVLLGDADDSIGERPAEAGVLFAKSKGDMQSTETCCNSSYQSNGTGSS